MSDTEDDGGTPFLFRDELGLLETETFEIHDHAEAVEGMASTSTSTSPSTSCCQ